MALESRDVENINPQRFSKQSVREITRDEKDDDVEDAIDEREIFDLLRDINDPEHPMSLEELNVIQMENIEVSNLVFFIE